MTLFTKEHSSLSEPDPARHAVCEVEPAHRSAVQGRLLRERCRHRRRRRCVARCCSRRSPPCPKIRDGLGRVWDFARGAWLPAAGSGLPVGWKPRLTAISCWTVHHEKNVSRASGLLYNIWVTVPYSYDLTSLKAYPLDRGMRELGKITLLGESVQRSTYTRCACGVARDPGGLRAPAPLPRSYL
jgi:hypothetical protein